MNVQPVTIACPQQKSTVNFKSKIVQTKYMDDLLRECISNPQGKIRILDKLKKILMDGKNNIVKIDYYKKGLLARLINSAYKISINGKENMWNCTFAGSGIAVQGNNALEDVLAHEDMAMNKPLTKKDYRSAKLTEARQKYKDTWKNYLWGEREYSEKKIKLQRKNLEYLKWKCDVELQKEFIKVRQEIFPDSPVINPPRPVVERFTDVDND